MTSPGSSEFISFGFEDEPTWRCQSNPLIRALGIQEPVPRDEIKEMRCRRRKGKR